MLMRRSVSFHRLGLGLVVAALGLIGGGLVGCGERDGRETRRHVIVSGGQGGVYYPTAGAIARLAGQVDPNLRLDVRTSGGSVSNARLMQQGSADFALIQNDIAAYAREGSQMFEGDEPVSTIHGLAALYPEHIQIVARRDAELESVADLAGKRVAIGDIGSGTEANALQILEAYELSTDDLGRVERLGASESREYLQDGRIDAAFFTFAVGTAAIQDLAHQAAITFVPVEGEGRERLMSAHPFYHEATIPREAYREGDDDDRATPRDDVPTVSVTATLVARHDVPEESVRGVLRAIFEHLDDFRATHHRLRDVNRADAAANLTLPTHPAAEAFYAETENAEAEAGGEAEGGA